MFTSYEIARSGLVVNERALYVTGHNIANVNTPGYVRQQAIIKDAQYQTIYTDTGMSQMGLGAAIQQIRQIRYTFLDGVYRQENNTFGYLESKQKTFQDVQAIMGEPISSGLQSTLNQFWDSWQELSKQPDSLTVRALVKQRGEALTKRINHMGSQLDRLQSDLNSEIVVRINEVNDLTGQIANLNVTILKTEVSGGTANDYRDQRNNLIDRLSKLADAEVNEQQDGQVDIILGGYYLAQKGVSLNLFAAEKTPGGLFYVPKLAGTDIEVSLKSGIIKGLMESRGEVSGEVGGIENGTPGTKTDVTFVVDISDTSGLNLNDVKSNILNYSKEMRDKGLNFNFRLVTTHGDNIINNSSFDNTQYNDFSVAVNSLTQAPATTATDDFSAVFNALGAMVFRPDDNKYTVIFTNDTVDAAEASGYNTTLADKGIKTMIVTDMPASGWDLVTAANNGTLYEVISTATGIGDDINSNVNDGISVIPDSNNIVSDIRKRLNALVNILMREVNYLHKNGKTMGNPPSAGDDFFTVINAGRPLEMGNIRLNPNMISLNSIAASKTGQSGDNSNALEIANLRYVPLLRDLNGSLNMDDYYQSIITIIGNNGSNTLNIMNNQSKLVQSVDSYRTSITGVSMDEEMSNMMKYKFAYDAASRTLTVIDQMLQTIVERMGITGR